MMAGRWWVAVSLTSLRAAAAPESASSAGAPRDGDDSALLQLRSSEVASGGEVGMSTFFWNTHWECSRAALGATSACKQRIGERFVELAGASQAEVVAAIELEDNGTQLTSLVDLGLAGWTQVDGLCTTGDGFRFDTAALAFAPEWRVEQSDGGCLRHDTDVRAFAVARAVPPRPVEGCPSLCVLAIHAPHSSITRGKDVVNSVCGAAVEKCAVAMGDWNAPGVGVPGLWSALIGGASPRQPVPDERSCCWPESQNWGNFDHITTNVPGARDGGHTLHPYQVVEERPNKQHRAVSAMLLLPRGGGSSDGTAAPAA